MGTATSRWEILNVTDPLHPDSDDDGLLDGFEVTKGSPGEQTLDLDMDGFDNLAEQAQGT